MTLKDLGYESSINQMINLLCVLMDSYLRNRTEITEIPEMKWTEHILWWFFSSNSVGSWPAASIQLRCRSVHNCCISSSRCRGTAGMEKNLHSLRSLVRDLQPFTMQVFTILTPPLSSSCKETHQPFIQIHACHYCLSLLLTWSTFSQLTSGWWLVSVCSKKKSFPANDMAELLQGG